MAAGLGRARVEILRDRHGLAVVLGGGGARGGVFLRREAPEEEEDTRLAPALLALPG